MPAVKFTPTLIKQATPERPPKCVKLTNKNRKGAYDVYAIDPHGLFLRVYPSGRKTFFVRLARTGKGQTLAHVGDASVMPLARAAYIARAKLNEKQDYGSVLKTDPSKATLKGFVEHAYEPWLRANRRNAAKTLKDLKRNFEKQLYEKRLRDITRADLDHYVSKKHADGCAAATIVRSTNNLRAVFRLALDRQFVRENPFKGWKKPKVEDNGSTRYLDAEEERRLRNALIARDDTTRQERISANDLRRKHGHRDELLPEWGEKDFPDHLTPMVLVSLNTGVRYGELTALEWPQIDFKARVLTVAGRTAKGAKTRHIPLNAEALDVLTRWKAQGDGKGLVFRNGDGSRIGTVKTAWGKLLEDAEISDFRWHDLRHTFASKLVQRGVDLAVVRKLLGHQSFHLTLRYAHLDDKQTAAAVEVLV